MAAADGNPAAVDPVLDPEARATNLVPRFVLQATPHPFFHTENIPPAAPGKIWITGMGQTEGGLADEVGDCFLEMPKDIGLSALLSRIRDISGVIPSLLSPCGVWVAGRRMKASGDTLQSLGFVDGQTIWICPFNVAYLRAEEEPVAVEDATQELSQASAEDGTEIAAAPQCSEDLRSLNDEEFAVYQYDLQDPNSSLYRERVVGSPSSLLCILVCFPMMSFFLYLLLMFCCSALQYIMGMTEFLQAIKDDDLERAQALLDAQPDCIRDTTAVSLRRPTMASASILLVL